MKKATNQVNDISIRARQTDRVKVTRYLHSHFFSLTADRTRAWFWLQEMEVKHSTESFEGLWRVHNQADFMTLYRVAAFWHSLYVLYKADEAEKPLAGHLFRYEFAYWARQMKWLVHNIKQKDSRFPDVLDPFLSTDWFVEAQPLIDTVSGFGVNN